MLEHFKYLQSVSKSVPKMTIPAPSVLHFRGGREAIDKVAYPADLKRLRPDQLPQLCAELRKVIMDTVTVTGGHLGSGMGVVELTVALHYVFDFAEDRLVMDVGHQAYPHKLLTGRKHRFHTLRQKDVRVVAMCEVEGPSARSRPARGSPGGGCCHGLRRRLRSPQPLRRHGA